MDRWGSEYHEDFAVIDRFSLLECSAAIVADQVLWTGASLFLWGLASRANCSTRLVPVGVEDRAIKEDFLAVSACCVRDICAPYSEGAANRQLGVVRPPPPPSGFVRLHADAEAFRKSWIEKHTASVQTGLSLQVICNSRCSQSLLNLGMIIMKVFCQVRPKSSWYFCALLWTWNCSSRFFAVQHLHLRH